MLAAADRVGIDADQRQQRGDARLDAIAQGFGLGHDGGRWCGERTQHAERHARLAAGRIEDDVRRGAQPRDALR